LVLTLGFISVTLDRCRNGALDGWQRTDLPTLLSVVLILGSRGEMLHVAGAQFQGTTPTVRTE
jgi:hypothetical protein